MGIATLAVIALAKSPLESATALPEFKSVAIILRGIGNLSKSFMSSTLARSFFNLKYIISVLPKPFGRERLNSLSYLTEAAYL